MPPRKPSGEIRRKIRTKPPHHPDEIAGPFPASESSALLLVTPVGSANFTNKRNCNSDGIRAG